MKMIFVILSISLLSALAQAQVAASPFQSAQIKSILKFGVAHTGFAAQPVCYLVSASYASERGWWSNNEPVQQLCTGRLCVKALGSIDSRQIPGATNIHYCLVNLRNGLSCKISGDYRNPDNKNFIAQSCFDAAGNPRRP